MSTTTNKAFWRSSNPTLNTKIFNQTSQQYAGAEPMTVGGAISKTAFLLLLLIVSAAYVWMQFIGVQQPTGLMPYLLVGAIGGLVVALIVVFKPTTAPYLSPVYALLEGVMIGAISSLLETRFPGIVLQAVGLTFGTLIVMLAAYRSGLIKATEKFKMGVVAATGAIFLVYLASFILGFFGIAIPLINSSGTFGIIFSLVVVVIAALNLVLDFDLIESGAKMGAPKFMEWYAAFGLLVTLVWLYLEILRLLSKILRR